VPLTFAIVVMSDSEFNCAVPLQYDSIVMAHGGGGRLMQQLLENIIRPAFNNQILNQNHDSAVFTVNGSKLAFTTDSYVIKPLFFPGGDIGKLAVCGTLNDLAMSGAKPLYLTCSLIIEEGLPLADLQRIIKSMQQTAEQAGVSIVTGDTKVVENGKGDGVFINTAGIGIVEHPIDVNAASIQPGDSIIINSDLARHGIAVMLERDGLNFAHNIESDCADLSGLVQHLIKSDIEIHCMRDLTRGGLAAGLIELASTAQHHFDVIEDSLPVKPDVKSACDILGFDPLYIANEGAFILFIPETQTELTLSILRNHALGQQACCIGQVKSTHAQGMVTLQTTLGVSRMLDLLSGEQLPRIC
jgi:hydrogenase expression/formation protein HypE